MHIINLHLIEKYYCLYNNELSQCISFLHKVHVRMMDSFIFFILNSRVKITFTYNNDSVEVNFGKTAHRNWSLSQLYANSATVTFYHTKQTSRKKKKNHLVHTLLKHCNKEKKKKINKMGRVKLIV